MHLPVLTHFAPSPKNVLGFHCPIFLTSLRQCLYILSSVATCTSFIQALLCKLLRHNDFIHWLIPCNCFVLQLFLYLKTMIICTIIIIQFHWIVVHVTVLHVTVLKQSAQPCKIPARFALRHSCICYPFSLFCSTINPVHETGGMRTFRTRTIRPRMIRPTDCSPRIIQKCYLTIY